MKTLYIIRHAKSSWEFNIDDHKRPLSKRGIEDAERIGEKLVSLIKPVDRVLCSDAQRAKMTAEIILNCLAIDSDIFVLEPNIYNFKGDRVITEIKNCNDKVDSLMVFGHNPGLTSIVNMFGSEIIDNLPTAGVVAIEFEVDKWKNISVGKNLFTLFPKELR